MNQLKKLTLKYFFQQKWEEIKWWVIPISVILGVILIGFGLGSFPAENGIYSIKMIIIGVSILGSWSLVGIIELIKTFCKWVRSNWDKATEKAIHKLNEDIDEVNYYSNVPSEGDLE